MNCSTVKCKTIALLALLLIIAMSFAACGGGSQNTGKPDKNGFDKNTNVKWEYGGFEFSIPKYWGTPTENDAKSMNLFGIKESDTGLAIIGFQSGTKVEKDTYEQNKEKVLESLISNLGKSMGSDDYQLTGNDFTLSNDKGEFEGRVEIIYNETRKEVCGIYILQSKTTEYNYIEDFKRVTASASPLKADKIDPAFKKTMDDYEAFFDEYVAFMEKYSANPTDLTLLGEMSDMLSKETEMINSLNNMDQSKMNSAELAYYLEVQARILDKLSKVSMY